MCCSPNPSPRAVSPGEGPWTRGPSFLSCVVDVPSSPLSARPFTPNDLGHRSALLLQGRDGVVLACARSPGGKLDRLRTEAQSSLTFQAFDREPQAPGDQ